MNSKDTLQAIELKKMKPADFIYLGVIFTLFLITAIMFFYSTSYIINNVNKVFSTYEDPAVSSLNIENYSLVEKRLNLPVNIKTEKKDMGIPVENVVIPVIDTAPVVTEVVAAPILDKKSITINILNGSKKPGVASVLSKGMENAGFSKATTGDSPTVYSLTTIFIKDNKKDYASDIEAAVQKIYPNAITKINPETSNFDVVIITGK